MRSNFPLTVVFLFLLNSSIGFAQNALEHQADSLLNVIALANEDTAKAKVYHQLTRMFAYSDHKRSLKYARAAIGHSRKAKHNKGISDGLSNMFNVQYLSGAPRDSLMTAIKNLEDHVRSIGDSTGMIKVYSNYALFYDRTGEPDKGLDYEIKSLELIRVYLKDPELEARALVNIGVSLNTMEKLESALEYFNRAKDLGLDNEHINAKNYFQLGTVYFKLNQLDSSKTYFDQASAYFETQNNLHEITKIKISLGWIYDKLKQFEKAEQEYQKAYQLAKDNDIKVLLPETYAAFSSHHFERGNYQLAVDFMQKYLDELAINDNYFVQEEYLEILHRSYAKLGQFEKAYETRASLADLKDSIKTAAHLNQIVELEQKFKVKEQESENELLATKNENAQAKLRNTIIIAIVLFIALLLASGWAYSVAQAKKKEEAYNQELEATVASRTSALQTSNKNLQQANYELRIFNYIASHDIKEPIRNISSYVSLIQKNLPEAAQHKLKEYFSFVKNSSAQLYTLIEDFARYTSLSKDEKINVQSVNLDTLTSNIIQTLDSTIQKSNGIVIFNDLPTIQSNSSLLFSALKNLIENGLKYNTSENPAVSITYNSTASKHEIIVKDNGVGIELQHQDQAFEMFKKLHNKAQFSDQGSGIGLAIVKLIMDKLDGSVAIESELDKGSTFILSLPKV